MNLPPKMQLVGDSEFLINHLLEKEKLETFISTSKIEEIENGETTDLYIVVLIANYNIENQELKLNNFIQSYIKLHIKSGEVISSNSINTEDIESYSDYSIFPKDVIEKYFK